jgi:predicted permease
VSPPERPNVPGWVRWALERLLDPRELRLVLDELAELHAQVAERHGPRVADRRYRRQLRTYPLRLALSRMGAALPLSLPGMGEVRRSVRSLLRAPALAATIVLTVGIGIGGCATIFSLVDALYLRPLPYPDAERLARIYTDAPPNRFNFSVVDFQALEAQQTTFERVAAIRRAGRALATDDGAELLDVVEGTPGLIETWGLGLLRGRTPTEAEGRPGAPGTVLLSTGFVARWLGADEPALALGRALTLDGEPYEVIGILPASLGPLARGIEVLPTLRLEPPRRKGPFFLQVYGRLARGVEPSEAARELRELNARLFPVWADSYQDRNASWGLAGVVTWARGDAGRLLIVLMGAVGMVLLIAITNAANLLLARVNGRGRELAVRAALGASAGTLRSHLLVESSLLALGGAALGLGMARAGIAALPVFAGGWLRRADEASLGAPTVGFALALAAGAGLLFAAVPALRRRERDLAGALRAGGRSATSSRSRQRSQRLLVAGQLAVVMPLLCGAALLLGSFARLQRVDPGFVADRVLTVGVLLSPATHPDEVDRERFWAAAIERVEALPGVEGAAISTERPPDDVNDINNFQLEDRPTPPGESERLTAWIVVDPSYFDVLGIPLLEGRAFEPADLDDEALPVVLVDETWARRNYPGESPVGRRLYSGGQTTGPRTTIVGVVGTVPYTGVGTSDLGATYQPGTRSAESAWLVVRTAADPRLLATRVLDELRRLDPTAPLVDVATGDDLLRASLTGPRHLSLLLGVFSAVALALAVVGIYGVTSHSVQQRRADIAVRLALGGAPATVLGRTLWEGMRVSLAGLALGLVAALLLTGTLSGLLYGVAPRDPGSLAAAAALLLGVSGVACLLPALRAVRVDPASTLREE